MEVEVNKWITPDSVVLKTPPRPRQDGFNASCGNSIPLGDVDPMVLSNLCDEFREDVFKKAGFSDPKKPRG